MNLSTGSRLYLKGFLISVKPLSIILTMCFLVDKSLQPFKSMLLYPRRNKNVRTDLKLKNVLFCDNNIKR